MSNSPTAATATEYQRDKNGFPIETCGRCGGAGRMPYSVHGGVCFKCEGAGHVLPAGVPGKLATQWRTILTKAGRVDSSSRCDAATGEITCDLNVGDQIRESRIGGWRTVAEVRITGEVVGWSMAGLNPDGTMKLRALTLAVEIVYTDGTTGRGGALCPRRVDFAALGPVRDEMAARARAAYESTLARRKR